MTSLSVPGVVACADAGEAPRAPADASRPNVLLIVLDTTRADALSSYGRAKPTTPVIDRLAAEGARYTNAFTTAFYTLPAHASLLTGLYPSAHRATSETGYLPQEPTTLAEELRAAGYRTAAFVSNPWVAAELGFGQGFERYVEAWRPAPGDPSRHLEDRGGVASAQTWIVEQADAGAPFFAFVNLNQAHLPYYPDPVVLARLSPKAYPMDRVLRLRNVVGMWLSVAGKQTFDDVDYEILNDLYEAEVAMLDHSVERLVKTLEDVGALDDTLVVVTSDHGENIGDHGQIDHMLSMYDTTIRIPLVLRYPARIPAGRVVDDLVSIVDLYPTVLDACGVPFDAAATPGRSLLDPERTAPAYVFAENERPLNGLELLRGAFPDLDTSGIDHRWRMVRSDRYKLIWREGAGVELYDVVRDPDENVDLSTREPEIRGRLEQVLAERMRAEDRQPAPAPRRPDAETLEELRALGYVE